MLHRGMDILDGVPVEVVVKRVSRINLRVGLDGVVKVSVPMWRSTLHEAEEFLLSKWKWVQKARLESAERRNRLGPEASEEDVEKLKILLSDIVRERAFQFGEPGVKWKIKRMKSIWGSCHWRKREITFNSELAARPREFVDYIVVHELTHLRAHNHGELFYALMDERLPNWRRLRRHLG
jgi:predicted metal-dependent hydrolase